MNIVDHNIVGNKILVEKFDMGYGDSLNIDVGVTNIEVQTEQTDSGIFIPTILESNTDFLLAKIIKFGDTFNDERYKEEMVVLISKTAAFEFEDNEKSYYLSQPEAIIVYWESDDYTDFVLCNNWLLVDEFTDHDYTMSSGLTVINNNNKLRALTGIVKKRGDAINDKSEIKEEYEVLYEKNSTKDIHINKTDYKLVHMKSVISYWE